jgi:uncharacterized protein YjbI with pentapeptide repeats
MDLSIRSWLLDRYININQIKQFSSGQIAGIAYRIAQDMEIKGLMPFEVCTLAEVLEMSLGSVWTEIAVLSQLTENLLRSLSQKKALNRNEGTWLAFQISYLNALDQVLNQEANLKRHWLDRAMIPDQAYLVNDSLGKLTLKEAQLQGLLKNLSPGKLTDTQAKQALSLVADSLLVQQMNHATVAWLVTNGAEEPEAKLLTQRLINSLPGYLMVVIANNPAPLAQLQKFVRLGNLLPPAIHHQDAELTDSSAKSQLDDKIDLYREYYRASFLQNFSHPLFMESFGLKDIYIPLIGLPIEKNTQGDLEQDAKPVDLMTWAQQQLADANTIAVIEAAPGFGKSSFCQIWAAQIARETYPNLMPILIKLQDITYGKTLLETLCSPFPKYLHSNLINWLEQDYPTCLLLLDGFDELPPLQQITRAKTIFIHQLLKFHSEGKHKILLTSGLDTLSRFAPELLLQSKRIIIQPLEVDGLRQWFQQWAVVQSLPIAQNFFTYLKQAGLFASQPKIPELSSIVRQPLMLYLLGILHRDGLLDNEVLGLTTQRDSVDSATFLWELYYRLSCLLLGHPAIEGIKTMVLRVGTAHINRTPEAITNLLAGRDPQDLIEQMQDLALKILHSNCYQVILPLASAPQNLPAFYFSCHTIPNASKTEAMVKIEFSHPQLGQFLCAQAIVEQLITIAQYYEENYGQYKFILDSPGSIAQQIYNLLGYGILSPEIELLIIAGLKRSPKHKFSLSMLYQSLESFWHDYCQGRWLDEAIAHQARNYFRTWKNPLNVEQINAAVGLNIFLLLCALAKSIQITFSPCGDPINVAQFNPVAVFGLISRTSVLHKDVFIHRTASQSLIGINLSGAYGVQVGLWGANLTDANLCNAELAGANLAGANLHQANLTGANLAGANLTKTNLYQCQLVGANLAGANLTGANLTGVNLNAVNLQNACLFNAILDIADQELAVMNGALLSPDDLPHETVLIPGEFISQHTQTINSDSDTSDTQDLLIEEQEIFSIESAEGVPTLSIQLYPENSSNQSGTLFGQGTGNGEQGKVNTDRTPI